VGQKEVTLETIGGGVLAELFDEELRRVFENVADVNTKADQKREIKISIAITPTKDRQYANTTIRVDSKLATVRPHESTLLLSFDGRRVTAYVNDPKQEELPMGNVTPITREGQE